MKSSGNYFVELTLAQAYIDLNTPGRISKGISALTQCITVSPTRPEPYFMLSRHYFLQKNIRQEKSILEQAVKNATDFLSFPER